MRLVISELSKAFGESLVLTNVDAVLEGGIVSALIGPSGSGKSTLLAIAAGYQTADHGSIDFIDEWGTSRPLRERDVVWVPQGSNLLGRRSVADNVMIGALSGGDRIAIAREKAYRALCAVGLEGFEARLANGLSGGEMQRVAVARAMVSSRPVIFADEPTANLDQRSAALVASAVGQPLPDKMIVIATHDPMLIGMAACVVNLGLSR